MGLDYSPGDNDGLWIPRAGMHQLGLMHGMGGLLPPSKTSWPPRTQLCMEKLVAQREKGAKPSSDLPQACAKTTSPSICILQRSRLPNPLQPRRENPAGKGHPDRPEGEPPRYTLGSSTSAAPGCRMVLPRASPWARLDAQQPRAPAKRRSRDVGTGWQGRDGRDGMAQRRHGLLRGRAEMAGESRADCVCYLAGALQNGLERERGTGLCRVLRQEVGVGVAWVSLAPQRSAGRARWFAEDVLGSTWCTSVLQTRVVNWVLNLQSNEDRGEKKPPERSSRPSSVGCFPNPFP